MRRSWWAGIVVPILVGAGLSGCAASQKRIDSVPVVQADEGPTEKPGWRLFSWRWWPKAKAQPAQIEHVPSDDSDVLTIGSLDRRKPSGSSGSPWADQKDDRLTRYFPTIGRRQPAGSQGSISNEHSASAFTRDRGVRQAAANGDEAARAAEERAPRASELLDTPIAPSPSIPIAQPSAKPDDVELKIESAVQPSEDEGRTPVSVADAPATDRTEPKRDARFGPSTDRTATLLGVTPAETGSEDAKPVAVSREETVKPSAPPTPQPTIPAIGEPSADSSIKIASADQPAPPAPKPSVSGPSAKPAPPAPASPKVEVPSQPKLDIPAAPSAAEPPSLVPAAPRAEDEPGAVPPPPEVKTPATETTPAATPAPATAPAKPTAAELAPAPVPASPPMASAPSAAQNWMPTSQTVPTSQLPSAQSYSAPSAHEDHSWGLGLFSGKLLPCLKKKFHKDEPVIYASSQSLFLPTYYSCDKNVPVASPQGPLPAPQAPLASAQCLETGHKKCHWLKNCQLLHKIQNCHLLEKLENCHLLQKVKNFKAQCKIKMCPCCSGGHKSELCNEGFGLASPQGVPTFSSPQTFAENSAASRSSRTEPRDLSKNRDVVERVSTDHVGEASQR